MTKLDHQKTEFLNHANKFALNNDLIDLSLAVGKALEILKDNNAEELLETNPNLPPDA